MAFEEWGPGAIVAEIKMHRAARMCSFLVVEGSSDSKFWKCRIDSACELVLGHGRPNVEEALVRLDGESFDGALGVVDADFDSAEELPTLSPNLVTTHFHDLECVLVCSSSLDRVLSEHGDLARISSYEESTGEDVRTHLLRQASIVGQFRWVSRRGTLGVDSSVFRPSRHLRDKLLRIEASEIALLAQEQGALSSCDWMRAIADLPIVDSYLLSNGHDLLEILRHGLRHVFGAMRASIGVDHLSALLRTGFDNSELSRTKLYENIREWESRNRPFVILPHPMPA